MNALKVWRRRYPSRPQITTNPLIADATNPQKNSRPYPWNPVCARSMPLYRPAPAMIGMRQQEREPGGRLAIDPDHRAAVMVMPDRETPGCSARACAAPRPSPVRRPIESSAAVARRPGVDPPQDHAEDREHDRRSATAAPSVLLDRSLETAPAITPGIVPITSAHASRSSVVAIDAARIEWNHASQVAPQVAAEVDRRHLRSVPTCSATSNVLLRAASFTIGPVEQPRHQDQMARTRDGGELGRALRQAEDDRLQDGHRGVLSGGRSAPCYR